MQRFWPFLVVFLLGGVSLVFGPRSGLQWFRLYKAQQVLEKEISEQKQSVVELETKIADLTNNPFAQMKAIRESLGYVHKKDLLFEFIQIQNDNPHR